MWVRLSAGWLIRVTSKDLSALVALICSHFSICECFFEEFDTAEEGFSSRGYQHESASLPVADFLPV